MERGRTEILNQALMYMGQDQILDPDGESKTAKLCASVYENTLAEALSEHPWTFATTATKLQQLGELPKDVRFAYAYQLPDECGRILSVECVGSEESSVFDRFATETGRANTLPSAEYSVQGRKLYSNQRDLQIVYVRTDVHPFEMSPQFRNYLAALIASKLFYKVNSSTQAEQSLLKRIPSIRMEAYNTDGQMTDTMPVNRPNLFVNARMY